ncbi:MAG: nitroreductase family deazaflavin-dependent oxidoreductase [Chloroflexi bacterium]|nr:nitroreductase family deazaflavin-dependent oxidoreductase [Chloroflexota bacterium]
MPLSRTIARVNRRITNPIFLTVAGHFPPLAIVDHVGRRSGRRYTTPIDAFRVPGGMAIALTYGSGAEWVQNVLAAGGCTLRRAGRAYRLVQPRVVQGGAGLEVLPAIVRPILRALGCNEVLYLEHAGGPSRR